VYICRFIENQEFDGRKNGCDKKGDIVLYVLQIRKFHLILHERITFCIDKSCIFAEN